MSGQRCSACVHADKSNLSDDQIRCRVPLPFWIVQRSETFYAALREPDEGRNCETYQAREEKEAPK